jgi:hypothetical protein
MNESLKLINEEKKDHEWVFKVNLQLFKNSEFLCQKTQSWTSL